jgi:hypothetical protein
MQTTTGRHPALNPQAQRKRRRGFKVHSGASRELLEESGAVETATVLVLEHHSVCYVVNQLQRLQRTASEEHTTKQSTKRLQKQKKQVSATAGRLTSNMSSSEWAALTQKRVRLLMIDVAGNPTTTTCAHASDRAAVVKLRPGASPPDFEQGILGRSPAFWRDCRASLGRRGTGGHR